MRVPSFKILRWGVAVQSQSRLTRAFSKSLRQPLQNLIVIPAQAGGPIGKICEIEIDLPDYTTRRYKRSTTKRRNKKGRKVASNGTSNSKPTNPPRCEKQDVKIAEVKPKRARGESTRRASKPESRRAAQKRIQENANKLQMPLF